MKVPKGIISNFGDGVGDREMDFIFVLWEDPNWSPLEWSNRFITASSRTICIPKEKTTVMIANNTPQSSLDDDHVFHQSPSLQNPKEMISKRRGKVWDIHKENNLFPVFLQTTDLSTVYADRCLVTNESITLIGEEGNPISTLIHSLPFVKKKAEM